MLQCYSPWVFFSMACVVMEWKVKVKHCGDTVCLYMCVLVCCGQALRKRLSVFVLALATLHLVYLCKCWKMVGV